MPNPLRGEKVNIGLIVVGKSFDIRLLKSASKLRMLDNSSSLEDLTGFRDSLHKAYKLTQNLKDLAEFLSNFPGGVQLSCPAKFAVDDINQYEPKVTYLFNELVKTYSIKEPAPRTSTRLITRLKRKFSSIEVLAKDPSELSEHKVVSSYILNPQTGLTADFLLKNGAYHLTEVIDYDVNNTKAKYKETTFKLMTFAEGKGSLSGTVNSYFVYSANSQNEKLVTPQINLAENYSDKIFNIASQKDEAAYFDIIQNAIGNQLPNIH